jgi:hypothetical protein
MRYSSCSRERPAGEPLPKSTHGEMPWHVEDWLRKHIHTSSNLKRKPRRKTMLEMLTEASGLLIAGAILWAGR